jgi:MoaA/NifB/PqqE/SkfB family radical SAM enzyme
MPEIRRAVTLAKRVVFGYTPTITKLWIEVTDKCNSKCRTCNIWAQPHNQDPLVPHEIYTVLSDPVFKDVDYIINSGGEPTTRDDLLEFLEAEHRALPNALLQLSTNGIQPNKVLWVVATLLERYPALKMEVGTSLEGIGVAHDHERRVPGNFESVDYMIKKLNELRDVYGRDRLTVGFGTVVTDRTINNIPALRRYADEKGIGMLIQWYNQSGFYSNEKRGQETEIRDAETESRSRALVKEADYTIISDLWCNYLEGKPHTFNCMALQSFCVIKCNGDIVPCLSYWNNRIGNVRNNSPSNILKRKGGITCTNHCLNSWATYWSFEADPIQYVRYFVRHPIKLVRKLCG